MTLDEYIDFYELCHRALKKLSAQNQLSNIEFDIISSKYGKNIIQEIIDSGGGERISNGNILKKQADIMLAGLYYERKILNLQSLKRKEEREELVANSSHNSSESAKWANRWAFISSMAAVISIIITLLNIYLCNF